jgi:microcystin-dependent protein
MRMKSARQIIEEATSRILNDTKAPPGWMNTDGRLLNRADYPELYEIMQGGAYIVAGEKFEIPDIPGCIIKADDSAASHPLGTILNYNPIGAVVKKQP